MHNKNCLLYSSYIECEANISTWGELVTTCIVGNTVYLYIEYQNFGTGDIVNRMYDVNLIIQL